MNVSMRKHIIRAVYEREASLAKGEQKGEQETAEAQSLPQESPRSATPLHSRRVSQAPSYMGLCARIALVVFVTIAIIYGANQAMVALLK